MKNRILISLEENQTQDLDQAAQATGLRKSMLLRMLTTAGLAAIKSVNYGPPLPLTFEVAKAPPIVTMRQLRAERTKAQAARRHK